MEIRFQVEGFAPSENAVRNARDLFELAAKELKCPPEAIREVTITDQAHFGPAIHYLAPGLPFTANEDYAAVAKTITVGPDQDPVASSIVLREFVFRGALAAFAKSYEERTAEEQRFIYVIWHEVAHALDATLRCDLPESPTFVSDPQGRFKVRHVASFFAGVVLSEMPACRLAAFTWSQAIAEAELQSDNATIVKHLARVRSEIASYGDPAQLRKMAFAAAQSFWIPFVQYGRAIAHISGNSDLSSAIPLWPGAAPGVEGILRDYGSLLGELFSVYPATPDRFETRLLELWQRLTREYGLDFRENSNSGDGMFWNQGRVLQRILVPSP